MMELKLIHELLGAKPNAHYVDTKNLPVWIVKSIDIYSVKLNEDVEVYLVKPTRELAFEQISNILNQIEKRLGGIALLIADDINPRFRALFVKNNVPFVYKNKSIFAPMLGLKLFDYKTPKRTENVDVDNEISSFELKILAGYLTGFITFKEFNLKQLESIFVNNNYQCSKGKLSQAVNQLIKLDYLDFKGSGPNRLVMFKSRDEVWELLQDQNVKRFHKTVKGYYMDNVNHIISGETALAHYSDLAEPKALHIALTNKELKALENNGSAVGDYGKPTFMFDVLKEPAKLFAIDGKYINPIELYFLLKGDHDERIQMNIEQMLESINLKI